MAVNGTMNHQFILDLEGNINMKKKMLLIGIYILSICANIFLTNESCLGQNTFIKARVNKNIYKEIYYYNYTITNNFATGDRDRKSVV